MATEPTSDAPSTPSVIEKTDILQFRDPNQPDLHVVFWHRSGYVEKPHPNILLWVHGLGEHCGRHKALATELLTRVPSLDGIGSYDHRGHGKSHGARGAAPNVSALIDDFVEHASKRMALEFGPEANIVIGGHSLGGLVVAGAAERKDWLQMDECGKIVGVLLSAPAVELCVTGINKVIAPFSGIAASIPGVKSMTKANGIDPKLLSHDKEAVKAYMADDLVHDQIGIGMGADLLKYGSGLISRVKVMSKGDALLKGGAPVLVMHGELDRVCAVEGSRMLVEACGSDEAELVVVSGAFHEIHNELKEHGREQLFETASEFLTKAFVGN